MGWGGRKVQGLGTFWSGCHVVGRRWWGALGWKNCSRRRNYGSMEIKKCGKIILEGSSQHQQPTATRTLFCQWLVGWLAASVWLARCGWVWCAADSCMASGNALRRATTRTTIRTPGRMRVGCRFKQKQHFTWLPRLLGSMTATRKPKTENQLHLAKSKGGQRERDVDAVC